MSRWHRHGLIFNPHDYIGNFQSLYSHASVPCAVPIDDRFIKIFFSGRDKNNRSFTYSIIADSADKYRISGFNSTPILKPGKLGTFDDSGAMATWIIFYNQKFYMYYIGWNLGVTVPLEIQLDSQFLMIWNTFKRLRNIQFLIVVKMMSILQPVVV